MTKTTLPAAGGAMPTNPTSEHPALKATRLARELASAMADDTDGGSTVAVIYPAGTTEYPLMFCYGDDFAAVTSAAFRYRDACRKVATGKGEPAMLPGLIKRCEDAHAALLKSFEVEL